MSQHSDSESDPIDQELQRLIPPAKHGDPVARNRIAELLRPRLRRISASRFPRMICRRTDASEIAQDALLDIFQSFDNFRGTSAGELKAWAYWKVKANLSGVYDKHVLAKRRSVKHEMSPTDASVGFVDMAASGSTPSAAAIRNEEREYFFREIELLPEDEKGVMELLYMGELTPPEVADALQVSTEEVEKIRLKALKRIAKRAEKKRRQESK